jgi:hypothetical protein
MEAAGLLDEGESPSLFARLYHTYHLSHVDVS